MKQPSMKHVWGNSFVICLSIGIILTPVLGNTIYINSYWNTYDFGSNSVTVDWSEAGKVDFTLLNFTGSLYVKNDETYMFVGIMVTERLSENMTWRLNFDVDSDRIWAEDAKEIIIYNISNTFSFNYSDKFYLQNDPTAYTDLNERNFYAAVRFFSVFDTEYSMLEFRIPFQSSDLLYDLQILDPDTYIIGLSFDVFLTDLAIQASWKGGTYPQFANASYYAPVIFAGPQDRKRPIFEEELPPPPETTTALTTGPPEDKYAGASSYPAVIGIITIILFALVQRKWRKRK